MTTRELDRTLRRKKAKETAVHPAWMEKPSRAGSVGKGVLIAIISMLVCYPFVTVLATSFASEEDITVAGGMVLWPKHPTTAAYDKIFAGGTVTHALIISIVVTLVGTALSMFCTITLAYALSRKGVTGGRFVLSVVLFTMLFSPGIIANFLAVKSLGLLGTFAAVILPVMVSPFNLIVMRSFFMGLPDELYDAARIDGAGEFRILATLALPLSKGVSAVVALFYAVSYWNSFFLAMLYLGSDKWPLAMVLRQYVLLGQPMSGNNTTTSEAAVPSQAIQMAVVIVALVPILAVYPFLQRFFTKGVLTGAIKG